VRNGVHIGIDRLREAQTNTGLSNEAISRRLHISERTWRRWRDLGEVPRYHLRAVAGVLGLEFAPTRLPPIEDDGGLRELLVGIEARQRALADAVAKLDADVVALTSELRERPEGEP
jgi:hypothetical protein